MLLILYLGCQHCLADSLHRTIALFSCDKKMFCGEHLLDRVVYDKTNSTKNDEANDSQDYFVLYYSKTGNKRKGVKDMDFNINDFQSVARATL